MNVADIIARQAENKPDAIAVVDGDLKLSYRQLDDAVWRAAAWARRNGIGVGDMVGIAMPSSVLYLVVVHGLARVGAIATGLSPADGEDVRQAVWTLFGIGVIVGGSAGDRLAGCAFLQADPGWLEPGPSTADPDLRFAGGDAGLVAKRSSGTTGGPKGVIYSHSMWIMDETRQTPHFPSRDNDRYLSLIDMNLPMGINQAQRTLLHGGTVFIPPTGAPAGVILDMLQRFAITRLAITPVHLDQFLPLLPAHSCLCPGLIDVSVAGMFMRESLRREIQARLSPALFIKYGSNEAGYLTCGEAELQERFPGTVGRPMAKVEIQVVDDRDRPLPEGELGIVRVRNPWLPSGYLNNPEATARMFRHGWFYIGDFGILSSEGGLILKGRTDDMMNFEGVKIMPADIEAVLLTHPAVVEAAAFPLPSERQQDVPAAVVVTRSEVAPRDLVVYCRERMGIRGPSVIAVLPSMPRNAMGKIVKRELAQMLKQKLDAARGGGPSA